ncbi:ATP-binding cassette domain-containing protein [Zooshikella harenae]|uniref:ATP-binding cassette domain-containing protein n=1 Tax=Zooshikella harenae TaxID=2827238 RepID=A0ABS5Z8U8_9GAMM|nr:ATP-binding cassette domain-containing protein [Zooshikella harenae]MBU2710410.1 ATP-binding cassette domain-containing protein [Zooshikella harenae]
MLAVEGLTIKRNQQVMCYSAQLKSGQLCALTGASGVGKSTLLEAITGLLPVTSGQLFWQGERFDQCVPGQRPVTMLFQQQNLIEHLDVLTNIALGVSPSAKLTVQQQQTLQQITERLAITELLACSPLSLSGGQRQRVALARCLLRQKPLLLLDEPFSALDPNLRHECLQLTHELQQQFGLTVLLVTHFPEEVASIADCYWHISEGGHIDVMSQTVNQAAK